MTTSVTNNTTNTDAVQPSTRVRGSDFGTAKSWRAQQSPDRKGGVFMHRKPVAHAPGSAERANF